MAKQNIGSQTGEPLVSKNHDRPLNLDKLIHERARLMIVTYLATANEECASFTELRDELGFSAGNLSIQLRTLESAGFVDIEKTFVDNKPYTEIQLTTQGKEALQAYLEEMEQLILRLKKSEEHRT
ncbi:MAG: transcriptional regulator [Termitinemataceae bacterium]